VSQGSGVKSCIVNNFILFTMQDLTPDFLLKPLHSKLRGMRSHCLFTYGSGLRGIECVRMWIKDINFKLNQIVVRNGKGAERPGHRLPG